MITSKNTVLKITAGATTAPFSISVTAEREIKSCKYSITREGAVCLVGEVLVSGNTACAAALFDASAWSPEHPVLYTANIDIEYTCGDTESLSDTFGFRYFSTDEKNIYLNGYPFYMRAYIRGCAAHEHENNCRLPEIDFYRKNFRMAKSYGFNTARFHSVIPTEACFRAADEIGMMIHIEMRKDNSDYDNLQEMLYGKNDFVSDAELENIINTLYNHPSFMVYCVGNEIRQPGTKPRIREIRDYIKARDNTRLFIDTCAHGEFDRGYVDFDVQHMGYYFPYGENADMFSDTDNLLGFGTVKDRAMLVNEEDGGKIRRGIKFTRPLIAHEVCHYTSWRDFYALKEKFEKYGVEAPWWIDEEIKLLEAKGYKDGFKDTLQITKNFQMRAWKNGIESIRASRLLSGFHMLQFADTDRYENSNGVVDCFDDPHGISAEEFKKFNADTVVLARLPKQIFTFGEKVKIPVILSQYAIDPPKSADFSYTLTAGDTVVRSGAMTDVDTGASGIYDVCSLEFKMPALSASSELTLECKMTFEDGSVITNSWQMWAFEPVCAPIKLDAKRDMQATYLNRVMSFDDNASLVITDSIDEELFERLDNGEDVMLIYRTDWTRHLLNKGMKAPEYSFVHTWDRYKAVIWDRGTINGGAVDKDAINSRGFATDSEINFQYYPLIHDSDKICLDNFPVSVNSIISGIDKCNRDRFDATKFRLRELRYERTMRRFSYAFEVRVGRGRLLVTGFNFTGVEREEPATVAMLRALVDYCNSEQFCKSTGKMEIEELKAYLSSVASYGPQKEGMMTQYWQLDEEPVESMEYWTESERYIREDLETYSKAADSSYIK